MSRDLIEKGGESRSCQQRLGRRHSEKYLPGWTSRQLKDPFLPEAEVRLAMLRHSNGLAVEFDDSRPSGDVGVVQTGFIGRAGLCVRDSGDGFLAANLKITPSRFHD
ncbi:hypothetical protein ACIBK9_18910 [Nonomuraea sp. NPDC050227]|uniref:hypothetical protein n=1 Tax=Nonomuraea sp. NPDC050227 TaxID=3364360 RepID=UPI0037B6CB0F